MGRGFLEVRHFFSTFFGPFTVFFYMMTSEKLQEGGGDLNKYFP